MKETLKNMAKLQ